MNKYHYILLLLMLLMSNAGATAELEKYNDMFHLKDYFIDAREMFNDDSTTKPEIRDVSYKLIEFKKTDKIMVAFDKSQFVPDTTGLVPDKQGLYYPADPDANRVTIKFGLDNVEVVEFLDLQAYSGCLDHETHPVNLAVSQFDPKKNVKEVTYTIRMPCRRYYTIPSYPYESVLMVKVKTSKGYFYNVHKLYSASRDECLRLWCKKNP